jgi:predicted house-cleaning noncanonical NTP pyrophosphatase (MazG superfamily)
MEIIYNKLVRDNIPNIIHNNGEKPITRILSDEEYKQELEKKLYEEYKEVLQTTTTEERIEELADMLEIITSLAQLEDKSLDDVIEVAQTKRTKRGGFKQKIFLEKVINTK